MKRLIAFGLFLVISLGLLFSCGKKEPPAEAYIDGVHLSEYSVVYPSAGLDYDKRAADFIAAEIKARTGIELSVVSDATVMAEHEIVVGETTRDISASLQAECEGFEFALFAEGGHIALEGDYFIIAAAAYYFIDTYVTGRDFSTNLPSEVTVCEPIMKEAKNFIFLIGDGMGVNHTLLFDEYENNIEFGDGEDFFYGYLFPNMGYSRTESLSGITDSAAGGTALSCGYKTYNEHVCRDKDGADIQSLTELASVLGKATAVMSTEVETGATPSTFSAHASNRDDKSVITQSQLQTMQKYGTVIDCGFDYYTERMINNSLEKHITDTLAKISADPDGFFIMYEEAHIDKHGHSGDLDKTFQAVVRFNQAIARFMEFAFYHPDTLVLITADHETGDLKKGEDGKYAYNSDYHTTHDVPVFVWGMGGEVFDGLTVENIQIAHTMAGFMGEYNFGDQSEYGCLID